MNANANMTAEEQFRIYGSVESSKMGELLDAFSAVSSMDGLSGTVREAMGCYPGEDILSKQIASLHKVMCNVRGENKAALDRIITELIEARREIYDDAEHGRDELRNVLKTLISHED